MSGVIVEDPMIDIRLQAQRPPTGAGGRVLGQMEEYFVEGLAPGDTFVFSGEVLRFEGMRETAAYVTRTNDPEAQVPSYNGGKFPLSTFLARPRARNGRQSRDMECPARSGGRVAADPGMALGHSAARPTAGRNLSARLARNISSAIRSKAGSRIRRSACC